MASRPASVTTLCAIGVILAVISIPSQGYFWFRYFLQPHHNLATEALHEDLARSIAMAIQSLFSVLLDVFLIINARRACQMNSLGRKNMVKYAYTYLVFAFISCLYGLFAETSKMIDVTLKSLAAAGYPSTRATVILHHYILIVAWLVLASIYPVCILIFFNRKKVRNAFEGVRLPDQGFQVENLTTFDS